MTNDLFFDELNFRNDIKSKLTYAFKSDSTKDWFALFGNKEIVWADEIDEVSSSFPAIVLEVVDSYADENSITGNQLQGFTIFELEISIYTLDTSNNKRNEISMLMTNKIIQEMQMKFGTRVTGNGTQPSPQKNLYRKVIGLTGKMDNSTNNIYKN